MRFKIASLLAAVITLSTTQLASAADLPVKAPVYKTPAVYNWTGFYGGAGLGWIHEHADWAYAAPLPATLAPFSQSLDSGLYSGIFGFQYQISSIVIGIEGSVNGKFSNSYASTTGGSATGPCTTNAGQRCETRMGTLWTFGGRLGYAWNDLLIYGEGGYASAKVDTQVVPVTVTDVSSQTHTGSYIGGGVDYVLFKSAMVDTIIGAEYAHINLGTKQHLASADGYVFGINTRNVSSSADIVRARLTFKWNPWKAF